MGAEALRSAPPGERMSQRQLAEVYERFKDPLMGYFYNRSRNHAESEDLTQQVFVGIVGNARGDIESEGFKGYVFTCAKYAWINRNRGSNRRGGPHFPLFEDGGDMDPAFISPDATPERCLLSKEALALVMQHLAELGPRTKDIYLRFKVDRMPRERIGEIYMISVSAVEKHIAKAKRHLAEKCDV